MAGRELEETRVFRPKSLGGTLRLYSRNPDSLLYAGGTEIIPRLRRGAHSVSVLPHKVIYLGNVPELNRISRTQRYLDIGSVLSFSRILSIGRNVLPPVLFEALSGIGTPALGNLATLGGNICLPDGRGDCLPALSVIDAQIELRTAGSSRWVPVSSFFTEEGRPGLRAGEVLTRIRVPLEEWDFQLFRKVEAGRQIDRRALSFAGTARFPKGSIEALHLCFGGFNNPVLRVAEPETRLKNAALPISGKLFDALVEELRAILADKGRESDSSRYRRATAIRMFRKFLEDLNSRSIEML
jgi:CO/xanthine dehydrogenase FAD-binding subunit